MRAPRRTLRVPRYRFAALQSPLRHTRYGDVTFVAIGRLYYLFCSLPHSAATSFPRAISSHPLRSCATWEPDRSRFIVTRTPRISCAPRHACCHYRLWLDRQTPRFFHVPFYLRRTCGRSLTLERSELLLVYGGRPLVARVGKPFRYFSEESVEKLALRASLLAMPIPTRLQREATTTRSSPHTSPPRQNTPLLRRTR